MAISALKLVGPFPLVVGRQESLVKRPTVITVGRDLPLQVRNKGIQEQHTLHPTTLTASRRDAMVLCMTSVSLAAATLFSTEPAEARIVKPEIRRKIMEKLEMLREKAGLSKPKSEDLTSAKDKVKTPPSVKEKIALK